MSPGKGALRSSVTLALLVLGWPNLASAQPRGAGATAVDLTDASIILGKCLVRKDRRLAESLLTLPSGPEREVATRQAGYKLVPCLGGFQSAKLPFYAVRGGVAETLLTEDGESGLKALRLLPTKTPEPIAEIIIKPAARSTGLGGGRAYYFACVAKAEPGKGADVLAFPRGSAAEVSAVEALRPAMRGCAPSNGELRFAPGDLRPMLAAALYADLHGTPIF